MDTFSTYTSTGLILSKNTVLYNNFGAKLSETNYLDPIMSTGDIVKKYVYNKDMELGRVFDENGQYSTYGYDGRGNMTHLTDPKVNSYWQTYNKRDIKTSDNLNQNNSTYTQTTYIID